MVRREQLDRFVHPSQSPNELHKIVEKRDENREELSI